MNEQTKETNRTEVNEPTPWLEPEASEALKPEHKRGASGRNRDSAEPGRVFLTWLPFSQRSQTLAESFRANPVYFGYLAGGRNPAKAALRYLVMTLHTIGFIARHRPRLIFVMNQPVFLPLTVYLLSFLFRYHYVIDSHSGLFNKREWNWALPLMEDVYRRSLFSVVTNRTHQTLVQSWGTRVEVLGALMLGDEPIEKFSRPRDPSLVIIGTFAGDEPTAEVIEACRRMPEFRFFLTGSLKRAPASLLEHAPDNVTLTGFMTRPSYVGMVRSMDAAIVLVKHDNVMQRGAYEAMSWAVPIITSDWRLLRQTFYRGTLFVDNSPDQIEWAVRQLVDHLDFYKQEISHLRDERAAKWQQDIARINSLIQQHERAGTGEEGR
jgi:glycosyltransferase involved in cell wall biosynthesis